MKKEKGEEINPQKSDVSIHHSSDGILKLVDSDVLLGNTTNPFRTVREQINELTRPIKIAQDEVSRLSTSLNSFRIPSGSIDWMSHFGVRSSLGETGGVLITGEQDGSNASIANSDRIESEIQDHTKKLNDLNTAIDSVKKLQKQGTETSEELTQSYQAVSTKLQQYKDDLTKSEQAWKEQSQKLQEEIETGKKELKEAKLELEKNKLKIIETLGIFTALFALITNASGDWSAPMFLVFTATIFIFLVLSHYLLTENTKIIAITKHVLVYSMFIAFLGVGIYIGNSWNFSFLSNLVKGNGDITNVQSETETPESEQTFIDVDQKNGNDEKNIEPPKISNKTSDVSP